MSKKLTERNKSIIELYLSDDHTLQEIGDMYGISRQRVLQIMHENNVPRKLPGKWHVLTLRRADELFDFIIKFKEENDGNSPFIGEMIKHFGGSLGYPLVNRLLLVLEEQGRIEIIPSSKNGARVKVLGGYWSMVE